MSKPTSARTTAKKVAPRLTFRPVGPTNWDDMVELFEGRGGPKHCWCMVWRPLSARDRRQDGKRRRAAMRRRVTQGIPIGILGYLRGRPVAWCSIAPRPTYRDLGGPELPNEEKVWSLVCFFVVRELRNRGVLGSILQAAEQQARRQGASLIEAYPVDAGSPSYRFMGFLKFFTAAGYREIGRAGTRRHIVQKRLQPIRRRKAKERKAG
jgi:GNAT superfamily N-acetyltransferase